MNWATLFYPFRNESILTTPFSIDLLSKSILTALWIWDMSPIQFDFPTSPEIFSIATSGPINCDCPMTWATFYCPFGQNHLLCQLLELIHFPLFSLSDEKIFIYPREQTIFITIFWTYLISNTSWALYSQLSFELDIFQQPWHMTYLRAFGWIHSQYMVIKTILLLTW